MIRKNLILCLAASLFIATPMEADAAQISLALAGGITSSLDESSTSDEQIANVLDEVVKNNYTGLIMSMFVATPVKRAKSSVSFLINLLEQ